MSPRILFFTLLCVGVGAPLMAQKVGSEAPDLTWTAAFEFGDIAKGKLSDLRGSVVLLEFFSVHTTTSKLGVAKLNELHATKAELGLVVVSVTSEDADEVGAYVTKQQIKHPVAIGYNEKFNPDGVPDAFLIDKDGKIAWHGHPQALDLPLLDKLMVDAKPAIVLAGLEDVQMLRRTKEHGAAYKKAKSLLESGNLSGRAQAQAKDWLQASEQLVAAALTAADTAEAAKDPYQVWIALEPVATGYQGVPGADAANTRFEALIADAKSKREIEAGKKFADAKHHEAELEFDTAYAIYKETEKNLASTKAGKAAGVAWRAIEKDGKLGFDRNCGYCKAGDRACPQHSKGKKKK